MPAGFSINGWVKSIIVTMVGIAIVFRVPMIEKIVIGSNTTRQ